MPIPKIILFDLGDVVCRFVPEHRIRFLSDLTEHSERDLMALFWNSGFSSKCDVGDYTLEKMCSFVNTGTGMAFSELELMDIWRRAFEVDHEVLKIAQKLSVSIDVGMLTNNPPLLRKSLPIWFPEIDALFDPIVFSYELGATKPNPEVFARMESLTAHNGSEILLIDDSQKNVAAATSADWQAIHYIGPRELEDSLTRNGLF